MRLRSPNRKVETREERVQRGTQELFSTLFFKNDLFCAKHYSEVGDRAIKTQTKTLNLT